MLQFLVLILGTLLIRGEAQKPVILDSFVVENKLSLTDGSIPNLEPSEVDEEAFNRVNEQALEVYAPIFVQMGKKLVMDPKWSSKVINAYASVADNGVSVVEIHGELARFPGMTADALMLVACHEIGHHIGGAPLFSNYYDQMSTEGQSDYFSTLKCMRRVFEKDDNRRFVQDVTTDPIAVTACSLNFKDEQKAGICVRSIIAAQHLKLIVTGAHLSRPDLFAMPMESYQWHPEPQCRLDTFVSGALCDKDYSDAVDGKDPNKGTCNFTPGNKIIGFRPLCWYGVASTAKDVVKPIVEEEAKKAEEKIKEELNRRLPPWWPR